MTQFNQMTIGEQQQYLLDKSRKALSQLEGFDKSSLQWYSYTHNAVFKFRLNEKPFLMKVDTSYPIAGRIQDEAYILTYLSKYTNMTVPRPLLAGDIDAELQEDELHYWIPVDLDIHIYHESWTSQSVYATNAIYEFLDGGSRTSDDVNRLEMLKIGDFLAGFHQVDFAICGEQDRRLFNFTRERLGKLDYDGLFGEKGRYVLHNDARQVFTDEQVTVMDTVAEKVRLAMDEIDTGASEFGLIHGDLLLKNILFYEGEVRALDFEYCGWGYYLYDLTPILWQLKPQNRYPELEQALWDGYTSIRPLSNRHRELLETFIAGRQVASMRWVAANRHNPAYQGKVEGIMAQRTAELQGFLKTGILNRQ